MARSRQFGSWPSNVLAFVLGLLTHQCVAGQGEDAQEVNSSSERLLTASGAQAGFSTALTDLETAVLSQLQKVHALTDGDTPGDTDILDGSFDVFDNGNKIRISANGVITDFLQYTQQCDGSTTLAGVADVHYFTCKLTKIWIAAFYSESESMDGFYIDGNLGADGKGSTSGGIFWESGGMAAGTFAHYRRVIGTGGSNGDSEDPSINQLVMVPSAGWYNNASADTDDGQHWVVQESGNPVAQIVYVLFTGHDTEAKASYNYAVDPDYINVITDFRVNFPDLLLFTTTSTTTSTTVSSTTSSTTTKTTTTVTTSTETTTTVTLTSFTTITITTTTITTTTEPPPPPPTDPPTETATTTTYTTQTQTTSTFTSVTATTSTTSLTTTSTSTSSATTTLSSTTTISTSTSSTSTFTRSTTSSSTSSATTTVTSTTTMSTTTTVTVTATTSTSSTSTSSATTTVTTTSTATTSTTRTITATTTTSSTTTSTMTTSTVTTQSTTTSTSATTTGTTTSTSSSTITTSTSSSSSTSTLTTTVSSTTSSTSTTTGTTSTTSTTTSSTTTTRSTTSSSSSSTSSTSSSSSSSTSSSTSTTSSSSSSTTTSSSSSTTSSTTTMTVTTSTSSTSSSTSSTTSSSTTTSSTTTSSTSTSTSSTSSTTTSSSSSSTTTSTWPDDPFFYNITAMAVVLRQALPGLQLMPEAVSGTTSMQDGILWEDGNKIGVKAGGKAAQDLGYVQQCLGQANYTGVSDVSYFTCQVNPQVFTAGFFSHDSTISEFEVSGRSPGGLLSGSGIGRSVQALDLGDHGGSSGDRRLSLSASYRGFGKQVYGGGLPSLNQLIMVPSSGGPGWYHEMGGNSGDNLHVVKQGTGNPVSEIYYLTWAGPVDAVYSTEQFTNAMGVVVDFMPDIIPYLLTTTTTSSTSYTRTQTTRTGTTSTATTTTNTTSTSSLTTSTVTTSTVTTTTLTTTLTTTSTTVTKTTTVTTSTVTTSTMTTSTVTTSTMTTTTPTSTTTTSMTVTTTSITATTSTATTSTQTSSTITTTTGTTTTGTTLTTTTLTFTTETLTTSTVSTSTVTTITWTTTTSVFPEPTDTLSAMDAARRENAGVAEEMRKILRDSSQSRHEFTTADGRTFVIEKFSWDLENITVPFDLGDGKTISVFIPVQALLDIGVSDDEAAIFIAPVSDKLLKILEGGAQGRNVTAVAQIELVYLMAPGAFIDVKNLKTPIAFTLPVNYTENMSCWVWDFDKNMWTDDGLTTVRGLAEDEQLQCLTTHLSFFGALFQGFLDTLLCGQFGLFTAENIGNLAKNDWHKETGSIVFFCIVGILAATFMAATFLDWKRDQTMTWKSEFFLIPLYDGPPAEGEVRDEETIHEAETQDSLPTHGPVMAFFCGIVAFVASVWACITESSAVRDAFDDIVSEWFEYVGELRSIIEGICDSLECSSCCATGAVAAATHSMMVSMTLNTSRKLTGASLRLSDDVVSFVMEDEDLNDILLRHQETAGLHEVMAREGTWRKAEGREEVWARLHLEIGKALQKEINTQTHCGHLPTSMWNLFLVHTPFGGVCVFDIFSSCKMRAFFFAIEMVGALLMCSLFFQASGKLSPPSLKEDKEADEDDPCDVENPPIAYRIGRLLAISLGSVFISGFPVHFLSSLHTRHFKKFEYEGCPHWNHQLRVWAIQDRMIWILGSMYIAFGLFFVSLFLANISANDHEDFMMGGIISVIQDCVLIPACIAFLGPCFAAVLLAASSKMQGMHRVDLLRQVHHKLHENTNIMLPIMQI